VVNARTLVRIAFGLTLLIAGGVLAQVRGWPPFYPHGNKVALENISAQAQVVAAPYSYSPAAIYEWPHVGTQKTQYYDGAGSARARDLLYLGAGNSGVARTVWFTGIGALSNWTDMSKYDIRIYTGAGNIANTAAPDTAHMTCKIPLGILTGGVYDALRAAGTVETPVVDYQVMAAGAAVSLNIPIPFSNGILIQLWNNTTNAVVSCAYHWTSYEVGASSFPYAGWVLRAQTKVATVAAPDTATTFLTVPSGTAGMLVGLFSSMSSDEEIAYVEGNWRFYPDGVTEPWETSGGEDIFGVNAYVFTAGEVTHENWGCTHTLQDEAPFVAESYRIFRRDPLIWSSGMIGTFQRPADVNPGAYTMKVLTLYYADE
jgi:hypothetical protein